MRFMNHLSMQLWFSNYEFSKRRVKPAGAASSVSDLDITECLCIEYQKRDNVPGVEIETSDNIFGCLSPIVLDLVLGLHQELS